jgi:hypothetical protein
MSDEPSKQQTQAAAQLPEAFPAPVEMTDFDFGDLVASIRSGIAQFGESLPAKMCAAIHEVTGMTVTLASGIGSGAWGEQRPNVTIMSSASLHPDEAIARCINVIDNMHGSDDQRRKVAASVLDHFSGR